MMTSPQLPRSPLMRCTRRRRCPVCDRDHYCSVSADGALCICTKKPSERRTRDGQAWVHVLRYDTAPPPVARRAQPAPHREPPAAPAPAERIHAVYTDLRRLHLVLSNPHRAALRARGLSDESIEFVGYRSAPTQLYAANIARALTRDYDLRGVPGFFERAGAWQLNFGAWNMGTLVPVCDAHGMIRALCVRRDDADGGAKYVWLSSKDKPSGVSPGAPAHFARVAVAHATGELTVTEGSLKAQIISELTGHAVCGIAGTSSFGDDFAASLRRDIPELRRVLLAYDSDLWDKPQVFAALERLAVQLARAGFTVRVRTWSAEFKGFDDYLVAQLQRKEAA